MSLEIDIGVRRGTDIPVFGSDGPSEIASMNATMSKASAVLNALDPGMQCRRIGLQESTSTTWPVGNSSNVDF
jgi:hypothetical protein